MKRAWGALLVAVAVAFCAGPVAWQIVTSVRPESELAEIGLPTSISLEAYEAVLTRHAFSRALLSSAIVAAATTALSLVISAAAAFALAKLRLRSRRTLLAGALACSMLPPIVTVSPLYLLMRLVGLRDELAGLVLPYLGFALPLAVWVLTDFFAGLPEELYRSARVDGCTPWQALRRVYLPIAGPGLGTVMLLVFVQAWNEFLFALTFLSSPEKRTVPVAIALFAAEHREPFGEMAAASVIAALPLAIAALVFQRWVVAGLTAGAVKE